MRVWSLVGHDDGCTLLGVVVQDVAGTEQPAGFLVVGGACAGGGRPDAREESEATWPGCSHWKPSSGPGKRQVRASAWGTGVVGVVDAGYVMGEGEGRGGRSHGGKRLSRGADSGRPSPHLLDTGPRYEYQHLALGASVSIDYAK